MAAYVTIFFRKEFGQNLDMVPYDCRFGDNCVQLLIEQPLYPVRTSKEWLKSFGLKSKLLKV